MSGEGGVDATASKNGGMPSPAGTLGNRMAKTAASYKMSFSTGGLFVNESLAVARLHGAGADWKQTILLAIGDGATSLPKAASNRRTLREIVNRLSCLTDEERQFLIDEADRPEQEAVLWLATCRAYRFVGAFAVGIIQDRYPSQKSPRRPSERGTHHVPGRGRHWQPTRKPRRRRRCL